MGLFGKGDASSRERSAADREAARLERERRRAERAGRPLADGDPAEASPEPAATDAEPTAPDAEPVGPEAERAAPDAEPVAYREPDAERGAPAEPLPRDPEPFAPAESHPFEPGSEPGPLGPEPEAFAPDPEAPGLAREAEPPASAREPEPPAPEPRAWGREAEPPASAREAEPPAPEPRAWGREAESPASAGEAEAVAPDDEPPVRPPEPEPEPAPRPRRTVALPRPQTQPRANGQVAEEEPIGVVRAGRASYAAQPGAAAPGHQRLTVPPTRRRRARRIVALVTIFLFVALVVVFAILLFQPFAGAGEGVVRVRIPPGAGAGEIGDQLAAAGVVDSGFFFSLRARLSGQRDDLRSGTFTMRRDTTYAAALDQLTAPPRAAAVVDITLPEGPSRRELAPRVRQAGVEGDYLAATRRSGRLDPRDYGAPRATRTLEGFLFPATYQLRTRQATSRRLVARQLDAFKDTFARVDLARARRRNLSRYDVLIIASMVEREVLVPRERRLIAGVVYNRLQQGIPLGIDATIRYARNNWSRPLRQSELQADSPYNTRLRRGLPPTPIGNPGLAAMRAAANPADTRAIYYVVRPCGNGAHSFSSTKAQFDRDVAAYNRKREELGGKDPSQC